MHYSTLGIHIKTKDFEKSRWFYETLGFKKIFVYGPKQELRYDTTGNLISAPEIYNGMTFQIGTARIEIADGHRAVKSSVFQEPVKSSKLSLMITMNNLHSLLKLCKQQHIAIAVAPRHYYWGTLEVVIKDPDGVVFVFICPYTATEAKKIHADETFATIPS